MSYASARRPISGDINKLYAEARAVHDWYRFVLSFPPHLVRDYLTRFGFSWTRMPRFSILFVGPARRLLSARNWASRVLG